MRYEILVVGVGGNGGQLVAKLARTLYGDNNADVELSIIDGDTVEQKNIGRQPYNIEDIGENKAVALASHIDEEFGLFVRPYNFYLTSPWQLDNIFSVMDRGGDDRVGSGFVSRGPEDVRILIGCCDNHECRKLMEDYFVSKKGAFGNLFYIDLANEMFVGEVVFSKKINGVVECPPRSYYFPDIFDKLGKPRNEMSCEELNDVLPQHLGTNSLCADLAYMYLMQLMDVDEPEKMPCGVCYFDAAMLSSNFVLYQELKRRKEVTSGEKAV